MKEPIAMLLLTGGRSSRMGTDKAMLCYEGEAFWKRIARELKKMGKLYVSVSAEQKGNFGEGFRIVDEIPQIGPMGGIVSAFHQTKEEAFFVCACDMPFIDSIFVRELLKKWRELEDSGERMDGLFVRNEKGRIYTTAGIYHRRLLPFLEQQVIAGRYGLSAGICRGNICFLEETSRKDRKNLFLNVNTMEDYKNLCIEKKAEKR